MGLLEVAHQETEIQLECWKSLVIILLLAQDCGEGENNEYRCKAKNQKVKCSSICSENLEIRKPK